MKILNKYDWENILKYWEKISLPRFHNCCNVNLLDQVVFVFLLRVMAKYQAFQDCSVISITSKYLQNTFVIWNSRDFYLFLLNLFSVKSMSIVAHEKEILQPLRMPGIVKNASKLLYSSVYIIFLKAWKMITV